MQGLEKKVWNNIGSCFVFLFVLMKTFWILKSNYHPLYNMCAWTQELLGLKSANKKQILFVIANYPRPESLPHKQGEFQNASISVSSG